MKLTTALSDFLRQNTQGDHSIFHQRGCLLNSEGFPRDEMFWVPGQAAAVVQKEAETKVAPLFIIGGTGNKKYAISMAAKQPTVWEIKADALKHLELDRANLRSVKTGELTQETVRDPVKEGKRVIPLGPSDLKFLFKDD